MSDQKDFKLKLVRRDKENTSYVLMKKKIHQRDITILNIYVTNTGAPNFIKVIPLGLKSLVNLNILVVSDFHTPLLLTDIPSGNK